MATGSDPFLKRLFGARKELLRGDSLFALLILVVVGVFLINLVTSLWHNIHFQRQIKEEAGIHGVEAIGSMLAQTTETLLIANELSAVRRVISEASVEHGLTTCSVIMPDGGIVADANPARITVLALPQTWESMDLEHSQKVLDGKVTLDFPLRITGRGDMRFVLTAPIPDQIPAVTESQTTQMALACLALATILLVHRHARFRLKAIGAIHEALLAVKDGESELMSLELDPRLGSEAVAWNRLLGEHRGHRVRAAIEQVQERIEGTTEVSLELAAVCDTLPQGLVLLNTTLYIDYANTAAHVLLKVRPGQLQGQLITDFITDEHARKVISAAVKVPNFKPANLEMKGQQGADTTVYRVGVRKVCACEHTDMVVMTLEDITQQRVADAARKGFLAHAAHELRTPLTNVGLYVEKAMEECRDDPTGTARSLSVINRESRRLEMIVQEILSISEIEAGHFSLQRDDVNVETLFHEIQDEYDPKAREKHIELCFELSPKLPILQADREKIYQACHNLIGNAIKYTPEKGRVQVGVEATEERLCIRVSDTGIGISDTDQAHIFDKFYRAKDRRLAHITGSGLGLAIARELIRLHGGDITVDSELNKGSTFTLTVPVSNEVLDSEHSNGTMRRHNDH